MEFSIAGSEQQFINKSTLPNFLREIIFDKSFLKFLILFFFNLVKFNEDPFLERLSTLKIFTLFKFFFKKIAILDPIKPPPPKIPILRYFFYV